MHCRQSFLNLMPRKRLLRMVQTDIAYALKLTWKFVKPFHQVLALSNNQHPMALHLTQSPNKCLKTQSCESWHYFKSFWV